MKIAFISDIHGNIGALESCYADLNKFGFDRIVSLGDVVGYCANPSDCIDFVIKHDIESICGNHDYYTCHKKFDKIQPYAEYVIKWMQDTLPGKYLKWLKALPFKMEIEGIECVHASLENPSGKFWPYVFDSHTSTFHFYSQKGYLSAGGHTHIPLLLEYSKNGTSVQLLKTTVLDKRPPHDTKILLNPGSVGQPRDFDARASSMIVDTDRMVVHVIRSVYDVEKTQREIIKAGLPEPLSERLASGL